MTDDRRAMIQGAAEPTATARTGGIRPATLALGGVLSQSFSVGSLSRSAERTAAVLIRVAAQADAGRFFTWRTFAILAAANCILLTVLLPPFMNADEFNHFKRANSISLGYLVGERFTAGNEVLAGGAIDAVLLPTMAPFTNIPFNPARKLTLADFQNSSAVAWDGYVMRDTFVNTAVYAPIFYLPQAMGILIGKALGLTVLQTFYLSRLCNGLVCIIIGSVALAFSPGARPFLFTLLLLPMSTALYANVSPDGLSIVTAAWATAVILSAIYARRPLTKLETIAASACLGLVALVKQPFLLLSIIMLAAPTERRYWRLLATAASGAPALLWFAWVTATVQAPLVRQGVPIDPTGQVAAILSDPSVLWTLITNTAERYFLLLSAQFVGVLGWLDTLLPYWYYQTAWVALALAFVVTFAGGRTPEWGLMRVAPLVAIVCCTAAMFASFLFFLTPVGANVVDGLQGRYFLPLAAFLPLISTGPSKGTVWSSVSNMAAGPLVLFPFVSLSVLPSSLLVRYYLS